MCFTQSAKVALRFVDHICPGDKVAIVKPAVKSLTKNNIIFSLTDPLIPWKRSPDTPLPQILPANDLDKAQYSTFDFVTPSVELVGCVPVDSVCAGTFCDSQS